MSEYQAGFNAGLKQGKEAGKAIMTKRIMGEIRDLLGEESQSTFADCIGVNRISVDQWEAGTGSPNKMNLRKILENLMSNYVQPLLEIYPVSPLIKKNGGWEIDKKSSERSKLRGLLQGHYGVYVFYNSVGKVTYIGHTARCLFGEIEARLIANMQHKIYVGEMGKKPVKREFQQGEVTAYISACFTLTKQAAINSESLLLRALMNDHQNRKGGNFRMGDGWIS